MHKYEHLNLGEREELFGWQKAGLSLRGIAQKLGRDVSTVSRELKRNTQYGKAYLPCIAQKRMERIGFRQRYKAPLKSPVIFLYVREHLRFPHFWTPEMIAGRIGQDIPGAHIAIETIYQYIYSKSARQYKLWELLAVGRKKRRKKGGRMVQRKSRIPMAISIAVRPKVIGKRKQAGHWETDTVEGPPTSKPALSVTLERVARYVSLQKVASTTATEKITALAVGLSKFPSALRQSITQDNGAENTDHQRVTELLGTAMFFCHPYHSWEKGSVENRNRVIRRFFPKGTDFANISPDTIQFVETVLNSMPLKCLRFKTPSEKMRQLESQLHQAKP